MAAGAASGALRGGGDRTAGPVGDGQGVSRLGFGILSPERAVGAVGLRLRHRGVFEPAARTRHATIRWRFASLRPTIIPTTTPSPPSGSRFLPEIEGLFVQVLLLARESGLLKLGTVALDGTKLHANASRHSALSYEHASKIEAQLKAEVAELLALAEAADRADVPDGMSIPEELARREERLRRLAEAKAKIEARAKERLAREQAEYDGEGDSARGEGPDHRQEAGRPTAAAAGGGAGPDRPDQSDRRRLRASCRSPAAASSRPTTPRRR